MLAPFRLAMIPTVLFAVGAAARAQELAPPGSGVSIRKLALDNGAAHTVKYYVQNGSPRLQAMVRRLEWAENELSTIEQLQLLKLDTVVNERRAISLRTQQLNYPYYPTGYTSGYAPYCPPSSYGSDSYLQRALATQLAYAATPQAALQHISFLEQMQTELNTELKALAPQEKKAAQVPLDALKPRLAALPHGDAPPPQPEAVAAPRPLPIIAAAPTAVKVSFEVQSGGTWYAAEVLQVNSGMNLIHYKDWPSSWDEWVPSTRLRRADAGNALAQR